MRTQNYHENKTKNLLVQEFGERKKMKTVEGRRQWEAITVSEIRVVQSKVKSNKIYKRNE